MTDKTLQQHNEDVERVRASILPRDTGYESMLLAAYDAAILELKAVRKVLVKAERGENRCEYGCYSDDDTSHVDPRCKKHYYSELFDKGADR